jgi:hypothetical protein
MPGRHTGNARHLTDPSGKIYYGTMEEGFYEVDVATLEPTVLYKDGNVLRKPGQMARHAESPPGAHGKGLYSGQGVLVYSNNGEASKAALKKLNIESGVLAEWDGRDWKLSHRSVSAVTFSVEVDPTGDGDWLAYTRLTVRPGERLEHVFSPAFQARWVRFVADADATATAWLEYR